MSWLSRFLSSSIGLKVVMAASGLALFGFTLAHMAGNLQVFLGADAYNHYAESLQGNKPLLWTARLGLLGVVSAHIASAVSLALRSKAARPVAYSQRSFLSGSYAVHTMKFGGFVLLTFIVYHLLHFTVGITHTDGFRHCGVEAGRFTCYAYENLTRGFQNPLVTGFYLVAQAALGLHLAHGVWSMARTLGLNNPKYDGIARQGAWAFAGLVSGGNALIALACAVGVVG